MSRLVLWLGQRGLWVGVSGEGRRGNARAGASITAPDAATPRFVPCSTSEPALAVPLVRTAVADLLGSRERMPRHCTLIVDLDGLDVAAVPLPPVRSGEQRDLLRREHDRYFVLDTPVAVTLGARNADGTTLALACAAPWLAQWRSALAADTHVDVVLAAPVAVALVHQQGEWVLTADETTSDSASGARIGVRQHQVTHVHRNAHTSERAREHTGARTPVDRAHLMRTLAALPVPRPESQLADETAERQWRRAGTQRVLGRTLTGVLAAAALLWLIDAWRGRTLSTREQEVAALTAATEPSRLARDRRDRAMAEHSVLVHDAAAQRQGPAYVLQHVAERLPRDAFVQRAEWDGVQWRVDGSASDAAALVPRLDADPTWSNVRSLAPSTRFLDGGRSRASFSIGFTPRPTALAPSDASGARP